MARCRSTARAERERCSRFDGLATLADVWLDGELAGRGDNMFAALRARRAPRRASELVDPLPRARRPSSRRSVRGRAGACRCSSTSSCAGSARRCSAARPAGRRPAPPVGPWRACGSRRAARCASARSRSTRSIAGVGDDRLRAGRRAAQRGADARDARRRRAAASVTSVALDRAMPARGADALAIDDAGAAGGRTRTASRRATRSRSRRRAAATSHDRSRPHRLPHDRASTQPTATSRVRVNGVPVFCRGACWTPLDVVALRGAARSAYAPPSRRLARAGMNMLRVGGTMVYEDDALYDALDEHGVLLWQDFMFANMDYPDDERSRRASSPRSTEQFARLQARPCVAVVCGNSEVEQQAAMCGARARALVAARCSTRRSRTRVAAALPGVPLRAVERARRRVPARGERRAVVVLRRRRVPAAARGRAARRGAVRLRVPRVREHPRAIRRCRASHITRRGRRARRATSAPAGTSTTCAITTCSCSSASIRSRCADADHERYLALGRVATGEVMARTFARVAARALARAAARCLVPARSVAGRRLGRRRCRRRAEGRVVRAAPRARARRARDHRRGRQRPRAARRQRSRRRRSPARSSSRCGAAARSRSAARAREVAVAGARRARARRRVAVRRLGSICRARTGSARRSRT